jgi:hypothetical protein
MTDIKLQTIDILRQTMSEMHWNNPDGFFEIGDEIILRKEEDGWHSIFKSARKEEK